MKFAVLHYSQQDTNERISTCEKMWCEGYSAGNGWEKQDEAKQAYSEEIKHEKNLPAKRVHMLKNDQGFKSQFYATWDNRKNDRIILQGTVARLDIPCRGLLSPFV